MLNDRPNFFQNDKKLLSSLLGIGGRASKTSDGVFLPIYCIVGRRQKRSWECSHPFFRRSLVLKAERVSVFKAFRAFGLGLQRAAVGVFWASFYLRMNTKKTPCKIQSVLLFLICFPIAISLSSESKRFCTFGLNSGCLITLFQISLKCRGEVPSGVLS